MTQLRLGVRGTEKILDTSHRRAGGVVIAPSESKNEGCARRAIDTDL